MIGVYSLTMTKCYLQREGYIVSCIESQNITITHNFEASYKLFINELRKITNKDDIYFKLVKPKLSDIKLISLVILVEFKSIDS